MINTIFSTQHATGQDEEKGGGGKKSGDFTSEVLAQLEPLQPHSFIISRLDSGRRTLSAAAEGPEGQGKCPGNGMMLERSQAMLCMKGESYDFGVSPCTGSGMWRVI